MLNFAELGETMRNPRAQTPYNRENHTETVSILQEGFAVCVVFVGMRVYQGKIIKGAITRKTVNWLDDQAWCRLQIRSGYILTNFN